MGIRAGKLSSADFLHKIESSNQPHTDNINFINAIIKTVKSFALIST